MDWGPGSAHTAVTKISPNIANTNGMCARIAARRSTTRLEPSCTTSISASQNGMLAVWMYLCGPPNGISINCIAESIGRPYKSTYCMIRDMMDQIRNQQDKILYGTCETDELYVRATSKGVPLVTNGENRTLPSRRGLPRGPGRGTFEKNTPMVTIYHQRTTKEKHDWTISYVPRDVQSLAAMVQERIMPGSVVMTD